MLCSIMHTFVSKIKKQSSFTHLISKAVALHNMRTLLVIMSLKVTHFMLFVHNIKDVLPQNERQVTRFHCFKIL